MFAALFTPSMLTGGPMADAPAERTLLSKAMQSIAHGFLAIFKANPYHDASGKFARRDDKANHHFVSVGGKFTRSNDKDRKAFGAEQTVIGNKLKPLFNAHKEKRLAHIQSVVDEKFNNAVPPPAPARPARSARASATATATRAAALAQREAIAARRAELQAQRQALVAENHRFRPNEIEPISPGHRTSLQNRVNDTTEHQYYRDAAARRLAGELHGNAMREHGLTLNSTELTASRVPAHHLTPDAFGRSLTELNQGHALRQAQTAQARSQALGESLHNMSTADRQAHMTTLSRPAYRAASSALQAHAQGVANKLDSMSHVDRQKALAGMSEGQRASINNNQSYHQRNNWDRAAAAHNEAQRVQREGPHTAASLHGMNDSQHAAAMKALTPAQRKNSLAAQAAHAADAAARVTNMGHAVREVSMAGMGQRQRQAVTSAFTPEQRAIHESQRQAHEHEQAVAAKAAAAAQARREQQQRERDAVEAATVANLPPHARQVHAEMKQLAARGMNVSSDSHSDAAKVAAHLSQHYPGVTPNEIVDAMMGKGAKIVNGSMRINRNGHLEVSAGDGSTVHGSRVEYMSRDVGHPSYGGRTNVHHSYLKLHPDDKGGGAVKKMFAASIPLYHKMGIKTVDVQANLSGGVYAWGRYGFDAKSPAEYHRVASSMMDSLHRRIPAQHMTPEAKKEMSDVAAIMSKHRGDSDLPSILTNMHLPHLDAATVNAGVGSQGTKSKFLATALSQSGSWNGKLDLSSKRQVKHLSKYVNSELPILPPEKP